MVKTDVSFFQKFKITTVIGFPKIMIIQSFYKVTINCRCSQSWSFMSHSTDRDILGQILSIATCGIELTQG